MNAGTSYYYYHSYRKTATKIKNAYLEQNYDYIFHTACRWQCLPRLIRSIKLFFSSLTEALVFQQPQRIGGSNKIKTHAARMHQTNIQIKISCLSIKRAHPKMQVDNLFHTSSSYSTSHTASSSFQMLFKKQNCNMQKRKQNKKKRQI